MNGNFQELFDAAQRAGIEAGQAAICRPMVVRGYEDQPVMDGVCGFAWIKFPGNSAFGRWAKKAGVASKAYPNGLMYWVGDFNQSMTRKEAYAQAFADVLRAAGIEAYADSRMD